MEQHSLKRIVSQIGLVAVAFIAAAGLQAMAFTEPTSAPTGGDVPAPINTGSFAQSKQGNLGVGISGIPGNTLEVGGNLLVDGTGAGGQINGLPGGVGIGPVGAGWFSDTNDLAARFPGASGHFLVESNGGGSTYLKSGADGTTINSLCLGGVCKSAWPSAPSVTFGCGSGQAVQSYNGTASCVSVGGSSVSGWSGTLTVWEPSFCSGADLVAWIDTYPVSSGLIKGYSHNLTTVRPNGCYSSSG